MALRIVQLGSPRYPDEGLRLGTVRRPPRGVPKEEFARTAPGWSRPRLDAAKGQTLSSVMVFDFDTLPHKDAYKLMTSCIVPRPIAWVVTQSVHGVLNAAPFSFFNMFSGNPPVVCIGVGSRSSGEKKDTALNVEATGEFVVNLVCEDLATRMNVTAIDFAYGINELAEAGLTAAASQKVSPPRIAESPVSLECVRREIVPLGETSLIIGQVVAMHIRDELVLDPVKCYVDTPNLRLIGRMHGGGWYVRTSDRFNMPRLTAAKAAVE